MFSFALKTISYIFSVLIALASIVFFIKKRCTANNRATGNRCLNPAAFGCKTCRYHGARKVLSGLQHHNYKHGTRTLEVLSNYSQKVAELDQLEDVAHRAGVMVGPKRRGRKPVVD